MERRIFDQEIIRYINLFEKITGIKVKDCFINSKVNFVVDEGLAGLAVGKNGKNIKKIEFLTKKKIRVIEFSKDIVKFINNIIYPIKTRKIYLKDNTANIISGGIKNKSLLIGRDSKNLKSLQNLVSKFFDVQIKIL